MIRHPLSRTILSVLKEIHPGFRKNGRPLNTSTSLLIISFAVAPLFAITRIFLSVLKQSIQAMIATIVVVL